MKLPIALLATITAAVVISSCSKKAVDPQPQEKPKGVDSTNGGGSNPDYCPACGMG